MSSLKRTRASASAGISLNNLAEPKLTNKKVQLNNNPGKSKKKKNANVSSLEDKESIESLHADYLVELKTQNIHILSSIVGKLKHPVKEISLEFSKDGLIIEAAEVGSPIQIKGRINRSQLKDYQYDNQVRLIEVQKLLDILRAVDKSNCLSIFVEKKDPLYIWIAMDSTHSSWRTRLKILVNDTLNRPPVLDLEKDYTQHLRIPSVRLGKALANFKNHTVHKIYLDAVDNRLTITQSEAGQPFSIFTLLGENVKKSPPSQVYHGEFDIRVLTQCTSKSNDRVSEYTDLYFHNERPLVMLFSVGKVGYLMFQINDCNRIKNIHQDTTTSDPNTSTFIQSLQDVESSVSAITQDTKSKLMRALQSQCVNHHIGGEKEK